METTLVIEIVKPILYALIAALATVVGIYTKKLGTVVIAWIKAKVGDTTYQNALEVAQGLYIYLEDKYGDSFKQMGAVKKSEMEKLLLDRFPSLTQAELDAINKTVWLSFQEGYDGTYSKDSLPTQGKKFEEAQDAEAPKRVDG